MKLMQYTYNFEPEMYKYILNSNLLNKIETKDIKQKKKKIFSLRIDFKYVIINMQLKNCFQIFSFF